MGNSETWYVDHREPESIVNKLLLRDDIENLKPEVTLEVGDYQCGRAIFERKAVGDLESSITDGRLKSQIKRMLESDFVPFIVVEGNLDECGVGRRGPPPQSVRGYCASIMARFNVPIVFCSDEDTLVDMMMRLADKANDEERVVTIDNNSSFRKQDDQMIRFLTTIDGIGRNTARDVKEHYPTPAKLIRATPAELQQIDGIGGTTANKILDAFCPPEEAQ